MIRHSERNFVILNKLKDPFRSPILQIRCYSLERQLFVSQLVFISTPSTTRPYAQYSAFSNPDLLT